MVRYVSSVLKIFNDLVAIADPQIKLVHVYIL